MIKEGKIDRDGVLWIKRCNTWKEMECPFTQDIMANDCFCCSDKCALFGEVEKNWDDDYINENGISKMITKDFFSISLCKKTLYFEKFEDERMYN